jgi:hypothetical protein
LAGIAEVKQLVLAEEGVVGQQRQQISLPEEAAVLVY